MPSRRPAVSFQCLTCGSILRAAAAMSGRTSGCPECERPVVVPAVSTQPADAAGMAIEIIPFAQLQPAEAALTA